MKLGELSTAVNHKNCCGRYCCFKRPKFLPGDFPCYTRLQTSSFLCWENCLSYASAVHSIWSSKVRKRTFHRRRYEVPPRFRKKAEIKSDHVQQMGLKADEVVPFSSSTLQLTDDLKQRCTAKYRRLPVFIELSQRSTTPFESSEMIRMCHSLEDKGFAFRSLQ